MIRFGQIEINSTTQTIRNGDRIMECKSPPSGGRWAERRFKAFKYLLCANGNGLTRDELFALVYGDDADGGPDKGIHVFDVQFVRGWGDHMKALGVALKREKRAGKQYLRMVPVSHVV